MMAKKSKVATILLGFLLVLLVLSLFRMIVAQSREDETTRIVREYIQQSPVYHQFHTLSQQAKNKCAEIFLESGNYAWEGYDAILFIETPEEVKLYAALFYKRKFRYYERRIEKKVFAQFFDELIRIGIWDIENYSNMSVVDGSTYFLQVINTERTKNLIVYGSPVFEPEQTHWKVIMHIENFCLQQIESIDDIPSR